MKAWTLIRTGAADDAFELRDRPDPKPGAGELRIDVEAFGLNFADIMARHGIYQDAPPLPSVLGYEVVGRVAELGDNVQNPAVGTRVVAFTRFGGYATQAVTDARAVAPIPEELDAAAATALATQYCTAYYCAEELVRLHAGDRVLIHAAAGGVGTALVQIAKHRGAIVFGTAGSAEKLDYLRELGVDYPINYRKQNFADAVRSALGDARRLDVAFDSVGGTTYRQSRKLLGAGGRIVNYGMAERSGKMFGFFSTLVTVWNYGWPHPVSLLQNSQGMLAANMLRIADHKPETLQRCLYGVTDLYNEDILRPMVGKHFPASELAEAHEFLESRESMGKVALSWNP